MPGHHRGDAGVRRVHVQPDASRRQIAAISGTGSTLVVDVVPTVATTASGQPALRPILGDRARERVGAHPELVVALDPPQRLVAEAQQDDRLVDRRVRLIRAVDAQPRARRAAGETRAPARRRRPLRARRPARAAWRSTRCRRSRLRTRRQSEQPPQPPERDLLELGRRRRCPPQHRLHVQRRGRGTRRARRARCR